MTTNVQLPAAGNVRTEPLLAVSHLQVTFGVGDKAKTVVEDASFTVRRGEARALVGESGSGKTVTALALMGLLPRGRAAVTGGEVQFDGRDLRRTSDRQLRDLRGRHMAMVFQEPMTSLNPVFTVGQQIVEPLRRHLHMNSRDAWRRAVELLDLVGIPVAHRRVRDYPHTFSGGMRQRAMIAMAIACEPELLIADEPTTALDVTVQAAILDLLRRLRTELDLAILLVTHDLGVVAEFCDEISVMYAGQVIESGTTDDVLTSAVRPSLTARASVAHPYTRGLINSIPQPNRVGLPLATVPGIVPQPHEMPSGCRFHPRCSEAEKGLCDQSSPQLIEVAANHLNRCVRVQRNVGPTNLVIEERP
ncbi:ABC transporter ATP-binding protein [Rhodococcoides fascians]|uniref:ABC transporter ATP-binding protein n=1 Tax=Rhodococcoides fascians TaxID=1828 RepID=UPI00068BB108|nr:ABC transporter ATP-binding protein [Rhodococcus fascians]